MAVFFACVASPVAFAQTAAAPTITVQTGVEDSFTLAVDLRRDISGFPDIADDTQMNFGQLISNPSGGGTLVASEGVVAFITVNTHHDPYSVVSQISTPLTLSGGSEIIPSGAVVLNSAYSAADNGGLANEGTANYSGPAQGIHTAYISGGTHGMRTVQAHYTITDNPALGATDFVPFDQVDGQYTTSLVISATRV